jgi:hypothetical protein
MTDGALTERRRQSEEERLRELFELWMEYLRRSESYRKLCELAKTTPFMLPTFLPDDLKGKKELFSHYHAIGDIFNSSFEEVWERRQDFLSVTDTLGLSVENWGQCVENDIDKYLQIFRKRYGRDPILTVADLISGKQKPQYPDYSMGEANFKKAPMEQKGVQPTLL